MVLFVDYIRKQFVLRGVMVHGAARALVHVCMCEVFGKARTEYMSFSARLVDPQVAIAFRNFFVEAVLTSASCAGHVFADAFGVHPRAASGKFVSHRGQRTRL